MGKYKSIRIKEETWQKLVQLKKGMETLDDVIQKLFSSANKKRDGTKHE